MRVQLSSDFPCAESGQHAQHHQGRGVGRPPVRPGRRPGAAAPEHGGGRDWRHRVALLTEADSPEEEHHPCQYTGEYIFVFLTLSHEPTIIYPKLIKRLSLS